MDKAAENTMNSDYIEECRQRLADITEQTEGRGVLLTVEILINIQKMEDALVDISEKTDCPYARMRATQALADWLDEPQEEEGRDQGPRLDDRGSNLDGN